MSEHSDSIRFIHRERTHNTHIKQYSVLVDNEQQRIPDKWKSSKRKIWVWNEETGFLEVKAHESVVFYSETTESLTVGCNFEDNLTMIS